MATAPSMPQAASKQTYTLIERLRQLAESQAGGATPPFLAAPNNWVPQLIDMAQEALALIEGETDPLLAKTIDDCRESVLVGGGWGSIKEPELETLIRAIINYRCRYDAALDQIVKMAPVPPIATTDPSILRNIIAKEIWEYQQLNEQFGLEFDSTEGWTVPGMACDLAKRMCIDEAERIRARIVGML